MNITKKGFNRFREPALWVIGLGVGVILLAGGLHLADFLRSRLVQGDYLEQQQNALQPAFRSDLESLDQAPRYTIVAAVDLDNLVVNGQMTVTYTNRTLSPLSELVFRLYPNGQAIYGEGSLAVQDVRREEVSLEKTLSQDGTILYVPLDPPLEAQKAVSLDLTFTTRVPSWTNQSYGILGQGRGVTSLAGWYPVLAPYERGWRTPPVPAVGDAMFAETSLYEVFLTVPEGQQLASTGTAMQEQHEEGWVTWHLVSGPAREFAVIIGDRFEVHTAQVGGVTLRLFAVPSHAPSVTADEALKVASMAFEAYVERFGPYPLRELDIVDAVVTIGGYEFPGMVYVNSLERSRGSPGTYGYLLAHELAHQWWFGLVGNRTVDEPWLDESFATYSAVLYLERAFGPRTGENLVTYWKKTYGLPKPGEAPVDSSALDFDSWSPYRDAVYVRGALFLDQLRETIGDEAFFQLLQQYQELYRYQIVETQDFLGLAESVADQDLDALFGHWFSAGSWK